MLEWLVPFAGFWLVSVLYLGSLPTSIEGGTGPRQVLGLLICFAIFVGGWAGARAALGGMGFVGREVLPSAVVVVLYPAIAWIGFKVVGVSVKWDGGSAHSH